MDQEVFRVIAKQKNKSKKIVEYLKVIIEDERGIFKRFEVCHKDNIVHLMSKGYKFVIWNPLKVNVHNLALEVETKGAEKVLIGGVGVQDSIEALPDF